MIRARLRSQAAWTLRSIARWLSDRADLIDPIKLSAILDNAEVIPSRIAFDANGRTFLMFDLGCDMWIGQAPAKRARDA